ncbi:hypothetical protein WJX72_004071 [[Myrmecia] bisecta]|uniref:DNA ligase n=1 Tax=[Myrmecia] bisecta TaxID=41462 RepID=A0AAW1Q1I7_9CHLO
MPANHLQDRLQQPRKTPLAQLLNLPKVPLEKAQEVAAKASQENPGCLDYRELAEMACLILAMETEQMDDEEHVWQEMDQAREASLQEADREASAKPPVVDWPDADILQRHSSGHYTSLILPQLQESCAKDCLWQPPLRAAVVELIEVERNARRWYATCGGTNIYFHQLAKDCKAKIDDNSSATQQKGRKGVKRKAAVSRATCSTDAATPAADTKAASNVTAAATYMHDKAQELLVIMSKMPTTPGETPDCFKQLDDPGTKLKRLRKATESVTNPAAEEAAATKHLDAALEDEMPAAPASAKKQKLSPSPVAAEPPAGGSRSPKKQAAATSPAAEVTAAVQAEAAAAAVGTRDADEDVIENQSGDEELGQPAPVAPNKGKGAAKPKKAKAKAAVTEQLQAAGADKEEIASVEAVDEAELEKPAKKPLKLKQAPQLKAKNATKVEGVGLGALAAAAQHGTFDLPALATWKPSDPVPFAFLATTFEAIAEESKRLVITNLLINAFRAIIATTPADLLPVVYLCTNQVAPPHEGLELGIGDSTLIKALAGATGRKEALVKKEYEETGDLGTVACNSRATQRTMFKPAPLTVASVFKTFREIAKAEGKASQEKKKQLIIKLLVSAGQNEAGYIMRALQGKLRIRLAEQTVLVALAHAVLLQRKGHDDKDGSLANQLESAAQVVKRVYSECPSHDEMVPALLKYELEEVPQHVHFRAGVPVKPMLAKPTNGVSEVLDKFQDCEFTCEYKYDGERAQVHVMEGGKVAIYSRNSENNTSKYPDIAAIVAKAKQAGVKSVVLDCEAVAFDRATGKILPFQVLSTRARKDVKVDEIKVQVCLFAFDCLYLNGEVLLQKPLTERRTALYSALNETHGELHFATAKTSRELEELQTFLDESVAAGTEGLIVKTMDSTYEPSRRSTHWLKLKKDYLDGCGDSFDVVVIGAWFGKGKRTGVFGSYLLAVHQLDDEEEDEYQTISKIGTGFSEEQLKSLAISLKEHQIDGPLDNYRYGETLIPDVWFDAKTVWEVKAADLSISPVHRAAQGLVDPSKGISIRFPRLVRVREDKKPEQATSAEQVAEMYQRQALAQHGSKREMADEY